MTTYRTGNHWGVTIVREGDVFTQGRMEPNGPVQPPRRVGDQLVAVVVNGDQDLAQDICFRLNSVTPDVDHTNGAREALAWVRRALDIAAKPDEQLFAATVHEILRHAAAELGVDEDAPSACVSSPQSPEHAPVQGSAWAEALQTLSGFEVFGLGDDEFGAVVLKCLRCTDWQVETDTTSDTLVLAELVRRAGEHTEVCR